jgi:RNA polymerase sigma factor (sigma-70 family)
VEHLSFQRPSDGVSEERLVSQCLRGESAAWSALVDRYKNLVSAIIRRSGTPAADAADVSQAVWIDIYTQLAQLRNPSSLRFWIGTITRHKCYHWGRRESRRRVRPWDQRRALTLEDPSPPADEVLERLDRQQEIREAIHDLSPRCRELLTLLFLDDPPRPYTEVASRLHLAVGSIGFLRSTCLDRLRQSLEDRDLL